MRATLKHRPLSEVLDRLRPDRELREESSDDSEDSHSDEEDSTSLQPLKNYFNFQYSLELYVGYRKQPLNFLLDTGSSWTWVPGVECSWKSCPNDRFQQAKSLTFQGLDERSEVTYGIGKVSGDIGSDTFSFTNSKPIGQLEDSNVRMNFMVVDTADDLHQLRPEGVLGLSPKVLEDEAENAKDFELFVDELEDCDVIDDALFALDLRGEGDDSSILFGGFDQDRVEQKFTESGCKETKPVWMNIKSPFHWSVGLQAAMVGRTPLAVSSDTITLDSGSSLLYIPDADYGPLVRQILDGRTCTTGDNGLLNCECQSTSDYDPITLGIGSTFSRYWVKIRSEEYTFFSPLTRSCWILIQPTSHHHWILGSPFLRSYYSIFDLEHRRIGLAGDVESAMSWGRSLFSGAPLGLEKFMVGLFQFIFWLAIIVVSGLIVFIVRRNQKEQLRLSLYANQNDQEESEVDGRMDEQPGNITGDVLAREREGFNASSPPKHIQGTPAAESEQGELQGLASAPPVVGKRKKKKKKSRKSREEIELAFD